LLGLLLCLVKMADGPSGLANALEAAGTVVTVFAGGIVSMLSAGIVYLLAEIAEHTCPRSSQEMEAVRLAAAPPRQPGKIFSSPVPR